MYVTAEHQEGEGEKEGGEKKREQGNKNKPVSLSGDTQGGLYFVIRS